MLEIQAMKRTFDFLAAGMGLILLSPLMVLVAILTRFYDGGAALFIQERIGLDGRIFRMFKFRSMVVGGPGKGSAITVGGDSRITPLGHWLRKCKLDELPQLWNVFRGEMSLVGPRPEVPQYVALYTSEQRAVLSLRPGITDPASLAFFDESELLARSSNPERFYREHIMPEKIRLNLEYASRANLVTDILLILATILRALFGIKMDVLAWLRIDPPKIESELFL